MSRHLPVLTITALAALTLSGCATSPGSDSRAATTASCNVARTQLTALGGLVTSPSIEAGPLEDQPLDLTTAAGIRDGGDRLAGRIGEGAISVAYAPVHSALNTLADTVAAQPNSLEDIASATAAIDAAAVDLMALCASHSTDPTALSARAAFGNDAFRHPANGGNTLDISPHLTVGGQTSGWIVSQDSGRSAPWTMSLDKAESSVWAAASWGKDYVLRFRTDISGDYSFGDESGDVYGTTVILTGHEHTIYFNSDAPAITRIHLA